jgi:PAS domain S-box-containing protein
MRKSKNPGIFEFEESQVDAFLNKNLEEFKNLNTYQKRQIISALEAETEQSFSPTSLIPGLTELVKPNDLFFQLGKDFISKYNLPAVILNYQGEILNTNQALEKLFAFKINPGPYFHSLIHPEDKKQIRNTLRRIFNKEIQHASFSCKLIESNEVSLCYTWHLIALHDQEIIIGLSQKIHQFNAMSDALHDEDFLSLVFEHLDVGIGICNPKGTRFYFNKTARTFLNIESGNYTFSQLENKLPIYQADAQTIIPLDQRPFYRAFQDEHIHHYEMVIKPPLKKEKYLVGSAQPLLDSSGNKLGAILAFYDITARKRAEEVLNKAHEILEIKVFENTSKLRKVNKELREEINHRQLIQQALAESEERFRIMAETAPDAIISINQANDILFVNKAVEKVFGYKEKELNGQKLTLLMPDYLKHIQQEAANRYNASGKKYISWQEILVPGLHKNGSKIYLEVSFGEFKKEGKRTLTAIIRNVTEKIRIQEELQQSETKFRTAFEDASVGICLTSLRGAFHQVNRSFAKMAGYKEEELLSKAIFDLIPSEESTLIKERFKKLLNNEIYDIKSTDQYLGKNGNLIYVNASTSLLRDNYGRPLYFIHIVEDITKQKIAEENFVNEKLLSDSIINSLPGVFYLLDDKGELLRWNKNLEKVSGYTEKEMQKLTAFSFFRDFDHELIAKKMGDVFTLGKSEVEAHLLTKHGDQILYLFTGTKITVNDQPCIIGVGIDIQLRKEAELAIQQYSDELQELNARKDKFFSIIAHDLRSPIAGLMGLTRMLSLKYLDMDMKEIGQTSKYINKVSNNFYNLVNNLLEWSKVQIGNYSFKPTVFNLKDLTEDIHLLLNENFKEKQIHFHNELGNEVSIYADHYMVHSVLQNLFSNAIKYTKPGGQIYISSTQEKGMVKVKVLDTGIGMAPIQMQQLFKIEKQQSTKGTEGEPGTGLGLFLCKEFIQKHGGYITVESQPDTGTTFWFTLPQYKSLE